MSAPARSHASFSILIGAAAGMLSGLLGIGGGLVVGPSLMLAGVPIARAVGTALLVVAPVAAVCVVAEVLTAPGNLIWLTALFIALGGQLGAPAGAWLVMRLPERVLRAAFLALLTYAALRNLGLIGGPTPEAPLEGVLGSSEVARHAFSLALGVLAGASSTLFGIGGGVVVVPGLLFGLGGFLFHQAAATSLLAMVPTSARGAWLARRQGRVEPGAALPLVGAAIVAAGAAVLIRNSFLGPVFLARLFGCFLVYVVIRLLLYPSRRAPADKKSQDPSSREAPSP